MILVFLWDWSPFYMAGGWIQTRQSSCSGGCGKCGGRDCGKEERAGAGGGQRHYRCKEGRGEIRLCIKQTKLSTLQVSFHQCNFCQQNNRKRKGKVYELLVKHQDIRDGATETQTVVAGETERGLRKMSVLKKSQRGEIVMEPGLSKTVVATPIMASAIWSKNMQSWSHCNGKKICFVCYVQ